MQAIFQDVIDSERAERDHFLKEVIPIFRESVPEPVAKEKTTRCRCSHWQRQRTRRCSVRHYKSGLPRPSAGDHRRPSEEKRTRMTVARAYPASPRP